MLQVDNLDANFLYLENSDSPTHITMLHFYDQSEMEGNVVRFKHILDHIENRLYSAPAFYKKIHRMPLDIDYPYWVDDDNFDLEYHIRHLSLPKPGDWRQFCIQVSRLHSRSLDMSKPLWEMYVIEGLDNVDVFSSGSFAILTKIHHCALDEFTALELLESLHEIKPNPHAHEITQQHISHPVSQPFRLPEALARTMVNNTFNLVKLSLNALSNIGDLGRFTQKKAMRLFQKNDGNSEHNNDIPVTRFNGQLSSYRVFDGGFYNKKTLETFAQHLPEATISHAISVVCGEAIRRYLAGHNEAPKGSLIGYLQLNERHAGAHALMGNEIGLDRLELNTEEEDLLKRLQSVVNSHDISKMKSDITTHAIHLRSIIENMPSLLLEHLSKTANKKGSVGRQLMQEANCIIANLTGSNRPLYFLGAKLTGFTTISPLYSGCGLMFSAATYCDSTSITLTSDRDMIPDPEFMRQCLDEAFEGIKQYNQRDSVINIHAKAV
jgi:diacylglycerol O-acyltransferase